MSDSDTSPCLFFLAARPKVWYTKAIGNFGPQGPAKPHDERSLAMNRLMLPENQIMDFDLIAQKSVQDYFDTNYLIYFVLEGEVSITVSGVTSRLKAKDFILVDSCRHHSYHGEGHVLIARFIISIEMLARYYDVHRMGITCNSTLGTPEQYSDFRKLLERCISHYQGRQSGDGRSLMRLNSIYYQIIELLISSFAEYEPEVLPTGEGADAQRINDIISYIHGNFKHPISLNDLAERMYLSPAYISRYIKKKLGKNLGEYLTDIRLDFAVRELEGTDKTIARIALDNGFPNVSSFNKAFKEHYKVTPKTYQENYMAARTKNAEDEIYLGGYNRRLMDYLERREDDGQSDQEVKRQIHADASRYRYIPKNWCRMINIGRVISLLRGDVQEHVLFLKRTLNLEYVRLWDIYDDALQLNITGGGRHNFSKLDKVMDFLVNNKLRPYLDLGFKPVIILDAYNSYLNYTDREIIFKDYLDYGRFLESLLIHFLNRYGAYEVSQWIFEQWCDPRLFPEGKTDGYFRTFEFAYNAIKNVVPEAKLGGAFDRDYGVVPFGTLVSEWSRRNIQPDFLSVYCYRSIGDDEDGSVNSYEYDSQKADFLREYLVAHKEMMKACGMNVPVYVSEWNFTVVNRNVLNDSCFKGAYVMKNLMALCQEAEMVGYWFGTDLFVESEEAPKLLDGCCGLISYHGICKPAFYAMDFMNRLGNYLLAQDKNMMITSDGYDNYTIVCHNYKHLDVQYFMQNEKNIRIDAVPLLFSDDSRLKLNVTIDHVKNGHYYIKTRSIYSKCGSVLDEWQRLGYSENLNIQDIDYLRGICVPRITIYEYLAADHTLELSLTLEPHEIQCVHIFRQIQE